MADLFGGLFLGMFGSLLAIRILLGLVFWIIDKVSTKAKC